MIGIIDLIVLAIIIISVLFALYRGLVRELLGISSWLLAGLAALYSYDPFIKYMEGHFENVKLAAIISSVVLALIVLIVMTIVNAAITRRLRKSSLSGLDRIFGLVFGVARALLIVALIYIFSAAIVLSPKQIESMKKDNHCITYIQLISKYVESVFPENIKKDLDEYEQNKKERPLKRAERKAAEKLAEEAKKSAADYTEKDRQSLDDMVESIVEIGDIE